MQRDDENEKKLAERKEKLAKMIPFLRLNNDLAQYHLSLKAWKGFLDIFAGDQFGDKTYSARQSVVRKILALFNLLRFQLKGISNCICIFLLSNPIK